MSRLRKEFQIIPKAVRIFALMVAALFCFLFTVGMQDEPLVGAGVGAVAGFVGGLYLLLIGYVFADSKRRGMRHVLWTLIAVFVPSALGLIGYFLLREPVLTPCGKCGTPARREFAFCPDCGAALRRACPDCHQPVEPFWMHCASCGVALSEERVGDTSGHAPASELPPDEPERDAESAGEWTKTPGESNV